MPMMIDEVERSIGDIEADEVARAKAQMRAGLLMSLESPASRAGQLGRQILIHGRPLASSEIIARIDRVTVDDVRRIADRTFRQSAPSVALIGPVADAMTADTIGSRLSDSRR
jgi:predicted Zn-dependent peptidase